MITPYRYGHLDRDSPVEVYRNTNKKGVIYSIRQGGYVVAHADELFLVNAEFIVRDSGRKRVKKSGRKNVHAWVRGEIAMLVKPEKGRMHQVTYNPRKNKQFVRVKTGKPITEARGVALTKQGVFVDNTVQL